jgi:membrane fusion protein, heavy metal efflux system
VLAELGAHVRRGQTMATVFSPELAEAQTRYISTRAELEAHERELARTEKLVQIGAASRQELEQIHAHHTAQRTSVDSARSRLELLGLPRHAIEGLGAGTTVRAHTNVPAPMSGVVTERLANVGLNVDPGAKLFTVVDMSNVWVVADLYEKDFSRVRIGDPATIVTTAYPDLRLQGRVSYVDPQVSRETRTGKVRLEVPNPRNVLRLGMLAEAQITGSDRTAVALIPRSAVQNVADRSVVYVVKSGAPGQFTEREVRLGQPSGERVEVLSGVVPGDQIVAEGSFFLRAERERLGLRRSTSARAPVATGTLASQNTSQRTLSRLQTAKVVVGEQGYEPAKLALRAGVPARVTFLRTTDKTCALGVVFPSLNMKRALPLNQAVDIEFTPPKTGDIAFACGSNMLKGVIVVE